MLENATNLALLTAWEQGDQQAARILVQRYMLRLTALARSRLSRQLSRRLDADDIVMSAWRSFFVAVDRQRLHVPDDDDLWPLLVTMTLRKLGRRAAHHSADRRAVAAESGDATFNWRQAVAHDPTPQEAALVTDELESLMSRLSPGDRDILTQRLQGLRQSEIADALQCSERTVRRSLQRIRGQFLQTQQYDDAAIPELTTPAPSSESENPSPVVDLIPPSVSIQEILLQELVGSGAFGKVYRAVMHHEGSQVAVKFLRRQLWQDQRAVHQLIHEFNLTRQLHHPGIVRTYGWGQTPRGAAFLVMEWIDGSNLHEQADRLRADLKAIITCALSICPAVRTAHQAGIMHGDLTPDNVLCASSGRCVLTDFGFGRMIQPASVISAGAGGTPGYLAPEQISTAFGIPGPATDVFGLGGILYFLLTGHAPVTGDDLPDLLARSLNGRTICPVINLRPDTPADLAQLTGQCLSREPADRPDLTTVEQELRRIAHTL